MVLAWAFVHTVTRPHETHEPLRRQIALGLKFARADRQIGFLLLVTFVVTFVVYHAALMPVIVTDLLHEGTSGYALIQTTTGLGAIIGASWRAIPHRPPPTIAIGGPSGSSRRCT